jgi:hypothetical protein
LLPGAEQSGSKRAISFCTSMRESRPAVAARNKQHNWAEFPVAVYFCAFPCLLLPRYNSRQLMQRKIPGFRLMVWNGVTSAIS